MTFIGAVSGTLLVQHIQSGFLRQVLPLLIIGIGLYFLLMPRRARTIVSGGWTASPLRWWRAGRSALRRFFGPGAGSFYALAFVTLAGFNRRNLPRTPRC